MTTLKPRREMQSTPPKAAPITRGRKPKAKPKKITKMCIRCRQNKEVSEFYGNKGWLTQASCDAWCKECVRKHCTDIDTLREYCWYNNRLWSDDMWDRAQSSAIYRLSSDPEYVKGSKRRKKEMEDEATCSHFLKTMNLVAFYSYSPNIEEDNIYREFNAESVAGSVRPQGDDALPDDEDMMYSAKWNGNYTKRDIEFLDARYEYYVSEHDLDTEHLRDAAKKTCKLSLMADNVMSDYRKGKTTIDEVNKVFKMYDESAKSNMFAACKRRPGESEGGTSFSEIAARLQSTGKIEAVKTKWPRDTVDAMIDEYYGISSKLNREGVF